MPPRHRGRGADLGDPPGQHRIGQKAFGLVQFTRVDIGLACIASRIDQKLGARATQGAQQSVRHSVIQIAAAGRMIGQILPAEQTLVRLPYITGAAKQINHAIYLDRRSVEMRWVN